MVLPKSAAEATAVVDAMNASGWIDGGTRAVIVEFAVFSPLAYCYAVVQSLVEMTYVRITATNKVQKNLGEPTKFENSSDLLTHSSGWHCTRVTWYHHRFS